MSNEGCVMRRKKDETPDCEMPDRDQMILVYKASDPIACALLLIKETLEYNASRHVSKATFSFEGITGEMEDKLVEILEARKFQVKLGALPGQDITVSLF